MPRNSTKKLTNYLLDSYEYITSLLPPDTKAISFSEIANSARPCISDFIFLKQIASGAQGEIFLVKKNPDSKFFGQFDDREWDLRDRFALKVVKKRNVRKWGERSAFEVERDILMRAFHYDAASNGDPSHAAEIETGNLAFSYATFQSESCLFYLLHLFPNGDLFDLLSLKSSLQLSRAPAAREPLLSEQCATFFAYQILRSIEQLHMMGYVHRDIKPDNFLIDGDHGLVLADFGSSVCLGNSILNGDSEKNLQNFVKLKIDKKKFYENCSKKTRSVTPIGTPDYIAPESLPSNKAMDCEYSFKSDLWSVGVLMYEMVTGEPPFYDGSETTTYKRISNFDVDYLIFDIDSNSIGSNSSSSIGSNSNSNSNSNSSNTNITNNTNIDNTNSNTNINTNNTNNNINTNIDNIDNTANNTEKIKISKEYVDIIKILLKPLEERPTLQEILKKEIFAAFENRDLKLKNFISETEYEDIVKCCNKSEFGDDNSSNSNSYASPEDSDNESVFKMDYDNDHTDPRFVGFSYFDGADFFGNQAITDDVIPINANKSDITEIKNIEISEIKKPEIAVKKNIEKICVDNLKNENNKNSAINKTIKTEKELLKEIIWNKEEHLEQKYQLAKEIDHKKKELVGIEEKIQNMKLESNSIDHPAELNSNISTRSIIVNNLNDDKTSNKNNPDFKYDVIIENYKKSIDDLNFDCNSILTDIGFIKSQFNFLRSINVKSSNGPTTNNFSQIASLKKTITKKSEEILELKYKLKEESLTRKKLEDENKYYKALSTRTSENTHSVGIETSVVVVESLIPVIDHSTDKIVNFEKKELNLKTTLKLKNNVLTLHSLLRENINNVLFFDLKFDELKLLKQNNSKNKNFNFLKMCVIDEIDNVSKSSTNTTSSNINGANNSDEDIKYVNKNNLRTELAKEEKQKEILIKLLVEKNMINKDSARQKLQKQIKGVEERINEMKFMMNYYEHRESDSGNLAATAKNSTEVEKYKKFKNHKFYQKKFPSKLDCDYCTHKLFTDSGLECGKCGMIVHESCWLHINLGCEVYKGVKRGRVYMLSLKSYEVVERLKSVGLGGGN